MEDRTPRYTVPLIALCLMLLCQPGMAQQRDPKVLLQTLPGGSDSVAVEGEWAVVGDIDNCHISIYRYNYLNNEWGDGAGGAGSPFQQLPGAGNQCANDAYGALGTSVSIAGNLILVGAPAADDGITVDHGKVLLYQYNSGSNTWVLNTTIGDPVDSGGPDLQASAAFGSSVEIRHQVVVGVEQDDALLLVGAPLYDANAGLDAGKVYFYDFVSGTAAFSGAIEGTVEGETFGSAVTTNGVVTGGTDFWLIASSPYYDLVNPAHTDSGRVRVYIANKDSGAVFPTQDLDNINDDATDNLNLGDALALSRTGVLLVSAGSALNKLGGTYALFNNEGEFEYFRKTFFTAGGDVSIDRHGRSVEASTGRSVKVWETSLELYGNRADLRVADPHPGYGKAVAIDRNRTLVGAPDEQQVDAYYTPCALKGKLIARKWSMVGVPCISGATINDMFGGPGNLGTYSTNWAMYRQNGTDYTGKQPTYVLLEGTDTLQLGVGYWLVADEDQKFYFNDSVAGALGTGVSPDVATPPRDFVAGVHRINLSQIMANRDTPASNIKVMLSNPFAQGFRWSDMYFGLDGTDILLSWGATSVVFEGGTAEAYTFDSATGSFIPIPYVPTPGFNALIPAYGGYYFRLSEAVGTYLDNHEDHQPMILYPALEK